MDGRSRNPVVVGVDGTAVTMQAVRWAAAEAARHEVGLRLVHASDEQSLSFPRSLSTSGDPVAMARMRGKRFLRAAQRTAADAAPAIELNLVLCKENAGTALAEEAESASLLALGTVALRPLGRFLAGSVTVSLAAHAPCPVVLVRSHVAEDEFPSEGPIVVGVDESPGSDGALALAFDEASSRRAPLLAVHAWDGALFRNVWEELNRRESEIHDQAVEALTARLSNWREKYPDVAVDCVVRRGRPAPVLLDFADRAQMLVVGSRGRGGGTGLLLGSTSQALMSYALCPVLVAPHGR